MINKLRRAKKNAYSKGNEAWKYFNSALKQEMAKFQSSQADKNINNTVAGSRKWWNNIKSVTGEIKQLNTAPYINIDDTWLNSEEFSTNLNNYYLYKDNNVSLEFPEIPTAYSDLPFINEWDIHKMLTKIKTRKATHSSDFPSWVTRNNADTLSAPITNIMNTMMQTGIFPTIWKQAEISPLPKTSKPKTYKDYRPISLLFHLSKIAEKCVRETLQPQLPVDDNQYAYTSKLGTTDALVQMTTEIADSLDDNSTYGVQALCIDFSKAFDLLKLDILANKLLSMNINPPIITLVLNFLSQRTQCVRYQTSRSPYLPVTLGVPQGTILGPTLWNIYVQDLGSGDKVIKYADDTTIYSSVKKSDVDVVSRNKRDRIINVCHNSLQNSTNSVVQWCNANHQSINAAKTQHMILTLQSNVTLVNPITIRSEPINQTKTAKLLGVQIDNHMSFNEHVSSVIEKSRSAVHGLLTLKRHGVRSHLLVKFYCARILPILTYAAPSWFTYTTNHSRDALERHQSLCLRIIYPSIQSYTERREMANILTLKDHFTQICSSYATKVIKNTTHRLHKYVPNKQSTTRRHSERLADRPILTCRSALKSKSLFYKFT